MVVSRPPGDKSELHPQDAQHHHFGEGLAKGIAGVLLAVEVNDLPLQAIELVEKWLLNVVALINS
jgi:hypothetical protein